MRAANKTIAPVICLCLWVYIFLKRLNGHEHIHGLQILHSSSHWTKRDHSRCNRCIIVQRSRSSVGWAGGIRLQGSRERLSGENTILIQMSERIDGRRSTAMNKCEDMDSVKTRHPRGHVGVHRGNMRVDKHSTANADLYARMYLHPPPPPRSLLHFFHSVFSTLSLSTLKTHSMARSHISLPVSVATNHGLYLCLLKSLRKSVPLSSYLSVSGARREGVFRWVYALFLSPPYRKIAFAIAAGRLAATDISTSTVDIPRRHPPINEKTQIPSSFPLVRLKTSNLNSIMSPNSFVASTCYSLGLIL